MRIVVRWGARVRCTTPRGTVKRLLRVERDGGLLVEVDQQPAGQDEEELVRVVVLVPVEVAVDDAEAHDDVVDRRERLVEPRRVGRGLGSDVDEVEVPELVVEADVVVLGHGFQATRAESFRFARFAPTA